MKKIYLVLSCTFCFFILFSGINYPNYITHTYQTQNKLLEVKIGDQIWAKKNLNVIQFRNGDSIPEAKTSQQWMRAWAEKQPAWCYYDNDPHYGKYVGKLYNWYAVIDPRGLAPEGWHISSDKEWITLSYTADRIGGVGDWLKLDKGWYKVGNGNNESSFSALPGGMCNSCGTFYFRHEHGYWWTTTPYSESEVKCRLIMYNDSFLAWWHFDKHQGFSVRCVKD